VDAIALAEVKSLAEALEVPLAKVIELLADNYKGYMPLVTLALAIEVTLEESLFTKSTIDAYIATIIEL